MGDASGVGTESEAEEVGDTGDARADDENPKLAVGVMGLESTDEDEDSWLAVGVTGGAGKSIGAL